MGPSQHGQAGSGATRQPAAAASDDLEPGTDADAALASQMPQMQSLPDFRELLEAALRQETEAFDGQQQVPMLLWEGSHVHLILFLGHETRL